MGEDDIKKYFDIMVEKMDDHISIIAEGHQMLVERLDRQDKRFDKAEVRADRFETEVLVRFDKMDDRFDKVDDRFESFQSEVRNEFVETKSMIKLSYAELDRRMTTLEQNFDDLVARVDRLETNPS